MHNKNYDFTMYFDGATEPVNPGGHMGIGCVIFDCEGNKIKTFSYHIAANVQNSNNVAEYQAFGVGIKWLNETLKDKYKIIIHGDSKLVICQMNGEWKIGNGLYVESAFKAQKVFKELCNKHFVKLLWIPREQNQVADDLSKGLLIEKGVQIPDRSKFKKTW